MALEAAVGLGAGLGARSVALVAFGADSVIELISAGVLLRRLGLERAGGDADRVALLERRSSAVVGVLLFALALWVLAGVARDILLVPARPEPSLPGLLLAAASALVMPWIVATKRRVAARIGSAALRADAACGTVCAAMAVTLLLGLGLRDLFGWWWADPLAALGIAVFVVREGAEALRAARGATDGCGCCD
jgi:divalent metal cation (Fe/Co/Zn/Cd) transporter